MTAPRMNYSRCSRCFLVEVDYTEDGYAILNCPLVQEQIVVTDCPSGSAMENVLGPGEMSLDLVKQAIELASKE